MSLKRTYSQVVPPGEDQTNYPQLKIFVPERKFPEGKELEEEIKTPIINPEEYDTTFGDYKRALQLLDGGEIVDDCQMDEGGKTLPQYLWNTKTGCRNGSGVDPDGVASATNTGGLFRTPHGLGCCRDEKYPEVVHGEFLERLNHLVGLYARVIEHLNDFSFLATDLSVYERFLLMIDAEQMELKSLIKTDLGQVIEEIKNQPLGVAHILLLIKDTLDLMAEEILQFAKTREILVATGIGSRDYKIMLGKKYKILRQLFADASLLKKFSIFLTEMIT